MSLTLNHHETKEASVLEALEGLFLDQKDLVHAGKLRGLIDSLPEQRLSIAFCGHFSAGKSSLINKLCGAGLLPSSPIPTSANLVRIRNGESAAYIYRRRSGSSSATEVEAQKVPIAELDAFCKDGEAIESIEIHYPIPWMGDHLVLLDTPGIDSTDEAHFRSTESALHLADVIFYVMDYNHVQSEINFAFAKRLKEWGKPLYLLVNQIDKHKEEELSFLDYRRGVEQSFQNWNIQPEGILFISVKYPNYPKDEWHKVSWLMKELKNRAIELHQHSMVQSAEHLIRQHLRFVQSNFEPRRESLRGQLQEHGGSRDAGLEAKKLQGELAETDGFAERYKDELSKEIGTLIENANVIPAQTREFIRLYLESRRPGFKVGLFFSGAKTAQEVANRLTAFHLDFVDKVRAHLDWHLRDLLRKAVKEMAEEDGSLLAAIDHFSLEITEQWLVEQVNMGSVISDEYVMNYAKDIASEIKRLYRRFAISIAEQLQVHAESAAVRKRKDLEHELARYSTLLDIMRQIADIDEQERKIGERLHELMRPLSRNAGGEAAQGLPDLALAPAKVERVKLQSGKALPQNKAETEQIIADYRRNATAQVGKEQASASQTATSDGLHDPLRLAAEKLIKAARLVEDIPAMASMVRSLRDKARRMENNTYTIALFGAFSAGKSSFANALMGERVLPVSPNPTTAAINKIMPPNADWPHRTAKVKMKTKEAVLEDVRFSLRAIGLEISAAAAEADMLRSIGKLTPEQISPKGKPHYAFLKAVEQGWKLVLSQLGTELKTDLDGFRQYVAEESRSCFVEWIELYYACPLTEQGVMLVDTPGADSINARHTGVAFNYIKNADAILFVTYYNHAFSQADREFLTQLGRVKDSFELDKMFFIVNAADLAASSEELGSVMQHVEDNLLKQSIRHPKLYPVSSLLAVEGKETGSESRLARSGLVAFEHDFRQFTYADLGGLAVNAAQKDLQRVQDILGQWIKDAEQGEEARTARIAQVQITDAKLAEQWPSDIDEQDERAICQEIDELFYYVKQRNGYRFGEFYNVSYHPSTLQDDGRNIKNALRAAWVELLGLISYDLSQEVLATSLRIENYLNIRLKEWLELRNQMICSGFPGFQAPFYENYRFDTPKVGESLDETGLDPKSAEKYFKNAKSFFEGSGKEELKKVLEHQLISAASVYVDAHAESFKAYYLGEYRRSAASALADLKEHVAEHREGLLSALEMKVDLQQMKGKLDHMEKIITAG